MGFEASTARAFSRPLPPRNTQEHRGLIPELSHAEALFPELFRDPPTPGRGWVNTSRGSDQKSAAERLLTSMISYSFNVLSRNGTPPVIFGPPRPPVRIENDTTNDSQGGFRKQINEALRDRTKMASSRFRHSQITLTQISSSLFLYRVSL